MLHGNMPLDITIGCYMSMKESTINIKEACLDSAHEIIAERGLDALSLREVARRLDISHQAPYKHFPSKDHLLAAVLSRCFSRFAYALEHREKNNDEFFNLQTLGIAYLNFAVKHPLEYQLMFNTKWPSTAKSEEMIAHCCMAFDVLKHTLTTIHGESDVGKEKAELDAIYIWSAMHGYASILQSNTMEHLDVKEKTMSNAAEHIFMMIRKGLT